MRLRVLTWNINGLRRIVAAFGGLAPLLDSLQADIICFQETKLTRSDRKRELALADGWESFFAFTRGKVGYSGVATFCRRDVTVPQHAEEGFTGVLALPAGSRIDPGQLQPCWQAAGLDPEQLRLLDGEGRVVITDHGGLVLVNVYGPAITSEERAEERMGYKMAFYQALQIRLDALLAEGRRVVLLGDLNIAPKPIDVCGADPRDFNSQRPDRAWLRGLMTRGARLQPQPQPSLPAGLTPVGGSMAGGTQLLGCRRPGVRSNEAGVSDPVHGQPLGCTGQESQAGSYPWGQQSDDEAGQEGHVDEEELEEEVADALVEAAKGAGRAAAPFVDTFRAFHPDRPHAYTCWNTSSGARVNNYGSRIDHILAADGTRSSGTSMSGVPAGGCDGGSTSGGRGGNGGGADPAGYLAWVVAADIMPDFEGSDHAPAWVDLELPDGELTRGSTAGGPPPPLSSRGLFDAMRQSTLLACLAKRPSGSASAPSSEAEAETGDPGPGTVTAQYQQNPRATDGAGTVAGEDDGAAVKRSGPFIPPGGPKSNRGKGAASASAGGTKGGQGQRKLTDFMKPAWAAPPGVPGAAGNISASRLGGGFAEAIAGAGLVDTVGPCVGGCRPAQDLRIAVGDKSTGATGVGGLVEAGILPVDAESGRDGRGSGGGGREDRQHHGGSGHIHAFACGSDRGTAVPCDVGGGSEVSRALADPVKSSNLPGLDAQTQDHARLLTVHGHGAHLLAPSIQRGPHVLMEQEALAAPGQHPSHRLHPPLAFTAPCAPGHVSDPGDLQQHALEDRHAFQRWPGERQALNALVQRQEQNQYLRPHLYQQPPSLRSLPAPEHFSGSLDSGSRWDGSQEAPGPSSMPQEACVQFRMAATATASTEEGWAGTVAAGRWDMQASIAAAGARSPQRQGLREAESQSAPYGLDNQATEGPGRSQAALVWRQIQDQMKPPRCSGHGEPCVVRTVKKKGENNGRQFWCCARADGLPPNGRCDFFQWARVRGPAASTSGLAGAVPGAAAGRGSGGTKQGMSNMPRKKPRT